MKWYTSDLHFSYEKIINLCNRPFKDVLEMNNKILENFREKIGKDDFLFILGDVSAYGQKPEYLIRKIPGHKILIKGNHDKSLIKRHSFRQCFTDIVSNEIVRDTVDDQEVKIFLTHYPMAEWDGYWKGIWQFYGHVHNNPHGGAALMSMIPTAINVGVDVQNFMPKTAEDLIRERRKTYVKPDLKAVEKAVFEPVFQNRNARKLSWDGFSNL